MIDQIKKANYNTREICKALGMAISTYYYQKKPLNRSVENERIKIMIKAIAKENDNIYGKRRIRESLAAQDVRIGIYRTASLMRLAGVEAKNLKRSIIIPIQVKNILKLSIY